MTNRLYVPKKKGRELACIENCVDGSIQGLEGYIKKSKEKLISTVNFNSGNISTVLENRNGKKKTISKFLATIWSDCTRESNDRVTEKKYQQRNWISTNSCTKQ